jgi:mediator of RNA polymerase II transcription subunit 12, fungi type
MWSKYKDSLLAVLPTEDMAAQTAYKAINARNERLDASRNRSRQSARQELVRLLDTTLQTAPFTSDIPKQCWSLSDDRLMIVRTVLEWCTSIHRHGTAKVYVAANLLRAWSEQVDVTGALLDFMGEAAPQEAQRKKLLYGLVSELVRSEYFHLSRYLQWLIARGGVSSYEDIDLDGPCSTRLLVELPLFCLGPSIRGLRDNLLRRVGFSLQAEADDLEMAQKCLYQTLGFPTDEDPRLPKKPLTIAQLGRRISKSNLGLRMQVGAWVREVYMLERVRAEKDGFRLPLESFNGMRSILEDASDLTVLADFIKSLIGDQDTDILASCTDTVTMHLTALAGMGIATELFTCLLERYKVIRDEQGVVPRPLLAALVNLAQETPGAEEEAVQLRKALIQSDRRSTIDVCTPASDSMVAHLQTAEGELQEEIEKLRASATSVDRQTMDRLFSTIVDRLETCWTKSNSTQRVYSTLLTSLRIKDSAHFDLRLGQWIRRVVGLQIRPPLAEVLPLLVSLGCLSMSLILASVPEWTSQGPLSSANRNVTWMQEILELVLMPLRASSGLTVEECVRFHIQQKASWKHHQKEVATLIRDALAEYSTLKSQPEHPPLPLDKTRFQDEVLDRLRFLTIADSRSVAEILSVKTLDPGASLLINTLATKLLAPTAESDPEISFDSVLDLANELTLPFCQLKLALGLKADGCSTDGVDIQQNQLDVFARAMDRAIDAKNVMWTSMLPCLSDEATYHLKLRAQSRFFDLLPSQKNAHVDPTSEEHIHIAENLLSVVESIARGRPLPRAAQLVPAMVDKLSDLLEILGDGREEKQGVRASVLNHWLPVVLSFVTLHTTTSDPTAGPSSALTPAGASTVGVGVGSAAVKTQAQNHAMNAAMELRTKILLLLAGIVLELGGVDPPMDVVARQLAERALDLGLVLVDGASEEARGQCVKVLLAPSSLSAAVGNVSASASAAATAYGSVANATMANTSAAGASPGPTSGTSSSSDPRLRYMFSYAPPPSENFMLSHRDHSHYPLHQRFTNAASSSSSTPTSSATSGPLVSVPGANPGNLPPRPNVPAPGMAPGMGLGLGFGAPVSMWGGVGAAAGGMSVSVAPERLTPFNFRRWEILNEFTPNVGENDTSLNLSLFEAIKLV